MCKERRIVRDRAAFILNTHARTHAQPFYDPLGFCPGLSG